MLLYIIYILFILVILVCVVKFILVYYATHILNIELTSQLSSLNDQLVLVEKTNALGSSAITLLENQLLSLEGGISKQLALIDTKMN